MDGLLRRTVSLAAGGLSHYSRFVRQVAHGELEGSCKKLAASIYRLGFPEWFNEGTCGMSERYMTLQRRALFLPLERIVA